MTSQHEIPRCLALFAYPFVGLKHIGLVTDTSISGPSHLTIATISLPAQMRPLARENAVQFEVIWTPKLRCVRVRSSTP